MPRPGEPMPELTLTQRAVQVDGCKLGYLEAGAGDGPLVVCLHGFPDSPRTFRHLAADLVGVGYRVVLPWLRGYPPSQVVDGSYQVAALARDAVALAEALAPDRPARLVGHDWGALATYGAGVLRPDRWQRLVTLSVPPTSAFRPFLRRDPAQQRASWYQFLFQLDTLSEAVVEQDDFAFLERLWRDWSPGWEPDRQCLDAARTSIRQGFPAALRFYRDTWQRARQDPELAADQRLIVDGPLTVPTLVLHGLRDGCILPGAFAGAEEYFAAEHRIQPLDGLGHFLHLEDPARVNPLILDFLGEP
jgi:pimeloyl-ACP methyl ester carboxylesterase